MIPWRVGHVSGRNMAHEVGGQVGLAVGSGDGPAANQSQLSFLKNAPFYFFELAVVFVRSGPWVMRRNLWRSCWLQDRCCIRHRNSLKAEPKTLSVR